MYTRVFRHHPGLPVAFLILVTFACQSPPEDTSESGQTPGENHPGISVVTSLPVLSTFMSDLIGDRSHVPSMLSNGQSPHGYHPRPSMARSIDQADLLILADPSIDGWAASFTPKRTVILSDLIPDTLRLYAGPDLNPHFWTDPVVLNVILPSMVNMLCDLNVEDCVDYQENARRLSEQLDELDVNLRRRLRPFTPRCVVSTEPFFEYFLRRYHLDSAGIIESTPGRAVSPRSLSRLLSSAARKECFAVLTQRSSPDKIASMFSTESGIPIVYLDIVSADENTSTVQIISDNAEQLMNLVR